MTSYSSYPFQGFGRGLNLVDKVDAVDPAECIDCLDVIFTDRGAITQRAGYDALTEEALTNPVGSLEAFYTTSGTKHLLAGCGTRLEAVNASGEVVDSETGLTNAIWDFARFGQPNSEVAYAGNGTDTLRKYNGTEWSTPTATVGGEEAKSMPKGGSICVDPNSNRLVVTGFSTTTGGPDGGTSSPSHVWFSDAGNPESYETTAFVQLTPGDGERIQACIAWRELVFVFKETKFFVFYGNSTDSEGKPVFNFRAVEGGVGLASPRAVCAHPTGVYFMSRHGVYRTTGQEPEGISHGSVEPIWRGGASEFYTGGVLAQGSITNCAMGVWEDRVYLGFPTSAANNRVLVYDPQAEWWSLLSIPAACLASFRVGSGEELVFGYASGSNHIGRHASIYTNDDGTAISSHWRSGWFDLDSPFVKKIRRAKVWGSGKVSMSISNDFERNPGTLKVLDFVDPSASVWGGSEWGGTTWAESRGLLPDHLSTAIRGTTFSTYFNNSVKDQEWSIHRVEYLSPSEREPSKVIA